MRATFQVVVELPDGAQGLAFDAVTQDLLTAARFNARPVEVRILTEARPVVTEALIQRLVPTNDVKKAVDDLWRRLGINGRALVALTSSVDGPFSLSDLARLTQSSLPTMKSRWATLGRSVKKTKDVFNVVVYQRSDVAWAFVMAFVMPDDVRVAVRKRVTDEIADVLQEGL